MADNDLKVIVKAKELAVHSFKLTSNCNRYSELKASYDDQRHIALYQRLPDGDRYYHCAGTAKMDGVIGLAFQFCFGEKSEWVFVGEDDSVQMGVVSSTGVDLDNTLTKSGKAADAKAVGDALDGIKTALDESIDDTSVSDKAWSGKNIVDRLCPAFAVSGGEVTCQPVEGYPLGIVSGITAKQAGSGYPEPDNVRPITGCSQITLHHNGTPLTVELGQTVAAGSYDWETGVLTVAQVLVRLTSDMKWVMTGTNNPNGIRSFYSNETMENVRDSSSASPMVSSHYRFYEEGWSVSNVEYAYAAKILNAKIYLTDARFTDLDSFKAFLDGENVQLMYPLANPVTVQLTPRQVLALPGVNTLYSNTGDTEVKGKADPIAINNDLQNRLAALEAALANNT